ncbi:MAG TPA: hypothetical protein PLX15_02330 [Candidatus Woesearchaeota archaeon]|nr:hypothetical protein [Candidatus Woesearchaeota archaeon]
MKNKYLMIAVCCFLLLGFNGCSEKTPQPQNIAFAGGTNGLIISWIQPSYGSNILLDSRQSSLPMILQIRNDGEYEVKDKEAKLKISGIYPEDFGIEDTEFDEIGSYYGKRIDLEGNVLQGSTELYEVGNRELEYNGKVKGVLTTNLVADLCYKYVTYASADLCVGNSVINVGGRASSCEISGQKNVASSGGPIQVTSFRQEGAGRNKIMLHFVIEHKGNGNVYKLEKGTNNEDNISCNPALMRTFDYINVTIGDTSGYWNDLKCGSGGRTRQLKLNNGKATIDCTLTLNKDSVRNYVKNVPITIEYLYSTSTSVPLIVKETIGDDSETNIDQTIPEESREVGLITSQTNDNLFLNFYNYCVGSLGGDVIECPVVAHDYEYYSNYCCLV